MFLASHGIVSSTFQSVGDGSLADVVPSAVFDLDATIAASYPGTGTTWANLVTAPADGSAQTDYDFFVGLDAAVTATDPTFNGSAGSAAAYWSVDGGDYFYQKMMSSYLASTHRTDVSKPITIVMTLRLANTSFNYLYGQGVSSGGQGWGLRLSSGTLEFFARGDSANIFETIKTSPSIPATTDSIFIISMDTQAGIGKYWINSTNGGTWTPSATAYTSDADTNPLMIGAGISKGSPMPSGSRIYSFSVFNEIFDNTKAAAIIAALETRHGRDYTP